MCDSSRGHWQQGAAAGRFRNSLAWSALLPSSSCRTYLGTWHWCRTGKGWAVLLPVFAAQVRCWCKPKFRKPLNVFLFSCMEKFPFFLCYLWKPPLWSCDCQGNLFLLSMLFLQHKKRSLNSIELLFHLKGGERSGMKKRNTAPTLQCYITYKIIY